MFYSRIILIVKYTLLSPTVITAITIATAILLFARGGVSSPMQNAWADRIIGTNAADTLTGTNDKDTIRGQGGSDVIDARSGEDKVSGGDGDDFRSPFGYLYGSQGNDEVHGDDGSDIVHGNAGNDKLRGDDENDRILGYAGNDRLFGGRGNDVLFGDSGADSFDCGPGTYDRIEDFNPAEGDTKRGNCENF